MDAKNKKKGQPIGLALTDKVLTMSLADHAKVLFYKLNSEIGSNIMVSGERTRLDLLKAAEMIKKEFKISKERIISVTEYNITKGIEMQRSTMLLIENNLIVDIDFTFQYMLTIHQCSTTNQKKVEKIRKLCGLCKSPPPPKFVHLLVDNGGKLSLRPFELEIVDDPDFLLNYHEDFTEVDRIIRQKLTETTKGVCLLHGVPGSGKSTYLKYLAAVINKRIIYIPSNVAHILASPDFLRFMTDYTNSIIILEDAEDLISERGSGGGYSISSLLNLSDGIVGDCLKMQLICTFNCPIDKIDKALLRKGRLLARYEFEPLEVERAQQLADKLGIITKITEKMTLANIYNMADKDFGIGESRPIGFKIEKE